MILKGAARSGTGAPPLGFQTRRLRLAPVTFTILALGVLAAACSSGSPSGSRATTTTAAKHTKASTAKPTDKGTTTTTAPSTTSTTAKASTTAPSMPPATNPTATTGPPSAHATSPNTAAAAPPTSAAPTPTSCHANQLQMTPQTGQGTAGMTEMSIEMVNISSTTCTMNGYPGMQLLSASGSALATSVVRGGGPSYSAAAANQPPGTVTLAPHQTAAFSFSYQNIPVGTSPACPLSSKALVTPPNDTTSDTVAMQIAPCGNGMLNVSPVYGT